LHNVKRFPNRLKEYRFMMFKQKSRRLLGAFVGLLALGGTAMAGPSSLTAEWYTIAFGNPDTGQTINGQTFGLVNAALGPNGAPVRSAFSAGFAPGNSNNITNVDALTDEILWWKPQPGLVSTNANYPGNVAIPFSAPANLFPGGIGVGGNGDPVGYLAAHLFGNFDAPSGGSITLTLGADDDAWIFVNGQLVVDNGGVKGLAAVPTVVSGLLSGINRIDVFFADRQVSQSGLEFSANVDFTPVAVPAPAALGVFLVGLFALAAARRRQG